MKKTLVGGAAVLLAALLFAVYALWLSPEAQADRAFAKVQGYYGEGEYQKAYEQLESACALRQPEWEDAVLAAEICQALGEQEPLKLWAHRLVSQGPDRAEGYLFLADYYRQRDQWSVAQQVLELAQQRCDDAAVTQAQRRLQSQLQSRQIQVTDWTGKRAVAAIYALREQGFVIDTRYSASDTYDLGRVTAMSPQPGTLCLPGQRVVLTVSTGRVQSVFGQGDSQENPYFVYLGQTAAELESQVGRLIFYHFDNGESYFAAAQSPVYFIFTSLEQPQQADETAVCVAVSGGREEVFPTLTGQLNARQLARALSCQAGFYSHSTQGDYRLLCRRAGEWSCWMFCGQSGVSEPNTLVILRRDG